MENTILIVEDDLQLQEVIAAAEGAHLVPLSPLRLL